MWKNLFIHCGLPKCASTSLQDFLFKNRELLFKNGFFFPSFLNENVVFSKTQNASDIGLFIRGDENRYINERFNILNFSEQQRNLFLQNINNSFSFLKEQINNSKVQNIILTAENLTRAKNLDILKREFKEFNLKFIFYIRPPVDFTCSVFQQNNKGTFKNILTLDEFIENDSLLIELLENIFNYSDIFGKESIIIRPLEKKQLFNECVYSDFLNILGLTMTSEYKTRANMLNTSHSFELTEVLRLINRLALNDDTRNKMQKIALKIDFKNKTKLTDTLTEEQINKINFKYEKILKRIATEFLKQKNIFLNTKIIHGKNIKTCLNNKDIEDILKTFSFET